MTSEHSERRAIGRFVDDGYPSTVQPEDIRAIRREEARRIADLAELPDPLTPEEYAEAEAEWARYQAWLNESTQPFEHKHVGCGHPCKSGACTSTAGLHDPLCIDCQLSELSDSEKHRAKRKVAS